VIAQIGNEAVVKRLFETIAPRYATRNGGYLRIMKAGFRHGDNAALAVIEFVDRDTSAKGAADRARLEAEGAEQAEAA
jgi:large subunit ribosomal protein L17